MEVWQVRRLKVLFTVSIFLNQTRMSNTKFDSIYQLCLLIDRMESTMFVKARICPLA